MTPDWRRTHPSMEELRKHHSRYHCETVHWIGGPKVEVSFWLYWQDGEGNHPVFFQWWESEWHNNFVGYQSGRWCPTTTDFVPCEWPSKQ